MNNWRKQRANTHGKFIFSLVYSNEFLVSVLKQMSDITSGFLNKTVSIDCEVTRQCFSEHFYGCLAIDKVS